MVPLQLPRGPAREGLSSACGDGVASKRATCTHLAGFQLNGDGVESRLVTCVHPAAIRPAARAGPGLQRVAVQAAADGRLPSAYAGHAGGEGRGHLF